MTASITDILQPQTRDEVLEDLLALASSLGLPTTSWQSGQPLLTFLLTVSQKISDLTNVSVEIAKGGFGDLLPSDDWADIWAESRFKVTRVPAEPATGSVDFTNTSATNYTRAAGQVIVAHGVTGKTYRNQAAITIAAGTGLAGVAIAADEPGTASNAAPGAIDTMVSSLVGVGVSNPLSVLGTDKETTEALVTRARAKLGALSPNGPKDAYNYVATTPSLTPGISTPVTRTRTVSDASTGVISVYLGTASGAPTAPDVAIVQTAIDALAEPWGATATAVAATPLTVAIAYHVWVKGSQLTSAQIQTAIGDALALYFSALPIGGDIIPPDNGAIYVEALEQVISASTPGILRATVTNPLVTTILTANQVPVLGAVTPTIDLL